MSLAASVRASSVIQLTRLEIMSQVIRSASGWIMP
jgi:hypothetical protein